ncbi:MAG: type II secretion system major pseudopilin GspG [Opitutales bacterium]
MYRTARRRFRHDARRSGFSLIEILIVIALIAMLATLVITNLDVIFGGQQEKVAQLWVKSAAKAPLTKYRIDTGSYPTTEQGLQALVQAPPGKEGQWKGPYIEEIPTDPWNNPYQYRFPGEKNATGYDLWSLGPDGQPSEDDIGNWSTDS